MVFSGNRIPVSPGHLTSAPSLASSSSLIVQWKCTKISKTPPHLPFCSFFSSCFSLIQVNREFSELVGISQQFSTRNNMTFPRKKKDTKSFREKIGQRLKRLRYDLFIRYGCGDPTATFCV